MLDEKDENLILNCLDIREPMTLISLSKLILYS